jgi:formylglycine-generating enzyme required for sulfatase activity
MNGGGTAFLSYSREFKGVVDQVAAALSERGVSIWIDQKDIRPGDRWQHEIEMAMEAASCCVIFVAPGPFGQWQEKEVAVAIDLCQRRSTPPYPLIPVLLPGASEDDLRPFLRQHHALALNGPDDAVPLEQLAKRLLALQGREPRGEPPQGPLLAQVRCPFKGLEYFDEKDAADFCGREDVVEDLLRRFQPGRREPNHSPMLLALVGNSGAGKSSLLRAGLLPRLRSGAVPRSSGWCFVVFRPGKQPIQELARALRHDLLLAKYLPPVTSLKESLLASHDALHLETGAAFHGDDQSRRVVLIVDQFEEIFTACEDQAIRKAFIDNILHAITVPDGHTIVILALRADCYGRIAPHPELAHAIARNTYFVTPLSREQLQAAIERPALGAGLQLAPGLVNAILNDALDGSAVLPLIQHCMLELYHKRVGNVLTLEAYQEIGGIENALQQRASSVYASLDPRGKEVCRRVLLRLIHLGDGIREVRRRASDAELRWNDVPPSVTERVIDALSAPQARLLTLEADSQGSAGRSIEVAHEALITRWSMLRTWLNESREDLYLQQVVRDAASEWEKSQRDWNFLFAGRRLRSLELWALKQEGLSASELDFLHACKRRRLKQHLRRAGEAAFAAVLIAALALSLYLTRARSRELSAMSWLWDQKQIDHLAAENLRLWPARPELVPRMNEWLRLARELIAKRESLQENLWKSATAPGPGAVEVKDLLSRIEKLDGTGPGSIKEMGQRKAFAESLPARTKADAAAWEEAKLSVESDSRFAGFTLRPRPGFVPIGYDQTSRLREFAHLESSVGETVPNRDSEGRLQLTPECGLVFVLVPGGTIAADGSGHEGAKPGSEANIRPFFISKYEMTQAQWVRLTGRNPSRFRAGTEWEKYLVPSRMLLHPVERVAWRECVRVLSRYDLQLPLERQWLYACHAGPLDGPSPWSSALSDPKPSTLFNVADRRALAAKANIGNEKCEEWEDDHAVHAPVDTFRPNHFGLHHMYGNVAEWCYDLFGSVGNLMTTERRVVDPADSDDRVVRGGTFGYPLMRASPEARISLAPGAYSNMIGVRPICDILE